MKLATLKSASKDGALIVVSRDLSHYAPAGHIAPNLLAALENWDATEPALQALYRQLNASAASNALPFDPRQAAAPLPRAPQWCDASSFLNHGRLMEKAFNIAPIPDMDTIPLMYQGASDDFLGACDDVPLPSVEQGIDFEGEYGVIVDDVPLGVAVGRAIKHIKLLVQINDVSLRGFVPREMGTGFGFLHAKPSSSFAPVAITPDELGADWADGRVKLPLYVDYNGQWFGHPNGREMNFGFHELIAHAATTRKLSAGTVIGSGTVSNAARDAGSACIAERRAIELIDHGEPKTPFMQFGDTVRMEAKASDGQALFGAIEQRVVQSPNAND